MASVELVWDMDVKMEAMYGVRSHALNWYGKWEVEALPYPIPAYMADVIMKPCTRYLKRYGVRSHAHAPPACLWALVKPSWHP